MKRRVLGMDYPWFKSALLYKLKQLILPILSLPVCKTEKIVTPLLPKVAEHKL